MRKNLWPTTAAATFPLGTLDWQEHAVCQWEDPEMFDGFPRRASGRDWERIAQAQRVCAECPVREQCLTLGISERYSGVWGGLYLSQGQVVPPGTRVRKESIRAERDVA